MQSNLKIPPVKCNNFINKDQIILKALKPAIFMTACLGYSRLYLIGCHRYVCLLAYLNCVFLYFISVWFLKMTFFSISIIVYKCVILAAYILTSLTCSFTNKATYESFFENINIFDRNNSLKESSMRSLKVFNILSTCVVAIFNLLDAIVYAIGLRPYFGVDAEFYVSYIFFGLDLELVFLNTLLYLIHQRVKMIRNRLEHLSPPEERNFVVPYRNFKEMSESIYFIHKQYDHLHSCSEDLNNIIKVSVTVTLVATFISTVFLIKTFIVFVLHFNHNRELLTYAAVLIFNRCLKHNAILAMLCLTTRLTTSEVFTCRVVIQKMKDIPGLDKEVRRQLKALLQLTTDKEFVYKLFWNIKIDMKLPLNYISICITYLVIVMQFDKFIT